MIISDECMAKRRRHNRVLSVCVTATERGIVMQVHDPTLHSGDALPQEPFHLAQREIHVFLCRSLWR